MRLDEVQGLYYIPTAFHHTSEAESRLPSGFLQVYLHRASAAENRTRDDGHAEKAICISSRNKPHLHPECEALAGAVVVTTRPLDAPFAKMPEHGVWHSAARRLHHNIGDTGYPPL